MAFRSGIAGVAAALLMASPAQSQRGAAPLPSPVSGANGSAPCLRCHALPNLAVRDSATLAVHRYTVSPDTLAASAHARLECRQCHADVQGYPHEFTTPRRPVSCGADCHATDAAGKPYTHQRALTDFESSAHRKGLTDATSGSPRCTTCHGGGDPHAVPKSPHTLTSRQKMAQCVTCHDDRALMTQHKVTPDAVSSYRRSFHYKAITFGSTTAAVCQDCHTAHRPLPHDSTASSIAVGNIAKTCGQSGCHRGAKLNFAMSGANHLALRIDREPILAFLELFFKVLTLGTMALLVAGIVLDVQVKYRWVALLRRALAWLGRQLLSLRRPLTLVWGAVRRVLVD
ncbi:MAG: hypothetical protein HY084_10340 [Gemmatimonadetes bacterium]|nr:hypothetical protein [Gemmatimonadota bacterium]